MSNSFAASSRLLSYSKSTLGCIFRRVESKLLWRQSVMSARSHYVDSKNYATNQELAVVPLPKIVCAVIPGDGVGPELAFSVKEVCRASGAPIEFEDFFFSEMNSVMSCSLEEVARAISRNKIAMIGTLSTPSHSYAGESQSLDMKLRY